MAIMTERSNMRRLLGEMGIDKTTPPGNRKIMSHLLYLVMLSVIIPMYKLILILTAHSSWVLYIQVWLGTMEQVHGAGFPVTGWFGAPLERS